MVNLKQSKAKNLLYFGLGAVTGLLVFFAYQSLSAPELPEDPDQAIETESEDHNIEIIDGRTHLDVDDNGLESEQITLPVGTTVTWINRSQEAIQLASDPHPDHDDHPDLESPIIYPDESYSYTFEDSGEYGYHDHLNPETNGTVVVE